MEKSLLRFQMRPPNSDIQIVFGQEESDSLLCALWWGWVGLKERDELPSPSDGTLPPSFSQAGGSLGTVARVQHWREAGGPVCPGTDCWVGTGRRPSSSSTEMSSWGIRGQEEASHGVCPPGTRATEGPAS